MEFLIMKVLFVAAETLGVLLLFFIVTYFIVKKDYSQKEILGSYLIVWIATTVIYYFEPQIKTMLSSDISILFTLGLPILFLVATFQAMKHTRK